ncbi:hypothetical protein ATY81_00120 [Rhizobium sp. R72]|uniref:DUF982 domain-containing protein n=1 Tax=unclassified Rhizobium TaxID=2613769 RepID=UPI000B7149FF|nr:MULTISPECIES: DUF982 domain-containing protein [unclassified Rhizobium]OWW04449.1 hypothetical protein ATY81_00120 [Rhizobium sp. R72]OWW05506.1 hypothetical protein ATY80_00120 [Rhizobium sp. R711]
MEIWKPPVIIIGTGSAVMLTITDSRAAMDFLLMRCPGKLSLAYQTAIYVCGRSIADQKETAAAQEAFLAVLSDSEIAFDFL